MVSLGLNEEQLIISIWTIWTRFWKNGEILFNYLNLKNYN